MYWHIEARVVLDLQEFINSVRTFINALLCGFLMKLSLGVLVMDNNFVVGH